MSLHEKSNVYLAISGALLFILGGVAVLAYVIQNPERFSYSIGTYSTLATEEESVGTGAAPEGYVLPELTIIETIELPQVSRITGRGINELLDQRRSRTDFADTELALADLSQMLWSAVGETTEAGYRTTPSRGRAYPVRQFVVVYRVSELEPGLYVYLPETHTLGLLRPGDKSGIWPEITSQPHPANAAATIMMVADMTRGQNFRHTTLQESGHMGQNLYLQAESLGLAMTVMGGFSPDAVHAYLDSDPWEEAVYLVPIGNRVGE